MSYQCVTNQRSVRFLIKSDPIFAEKEEDMTGLDFFVFPTQPCFGFVVCVYVFFKETSFSWL